MRSCSISAAGWRSSRARVPASAAPSPLRIAKNANRLFATCALALDPEVLIADEPVSALDVSVQAQVLHLLADIRKRFNLTMLFITHDLRVAAQVCDSVAVMRYGEVIEYGATEDLFSNPQHPYTRELLDAVPGKDWVTPEVHARPASAPCSERA